MTYQRCQFVPDKFSREFFGECVDDCGKFDHGQIHPISSVVADLN